jgi:hypothetical protein
MIYLLFVIFFPGIERFGAPEMSVQDADADAF